MEKLNEYLQNLISTCSYELHLEPNRPPYLISSGGEKELSNTAILGTQISMMVFPLIPNDVKRELPDQPEVSFVLPHQLGQFSFSVRKSPSGFNVTVKPLTQEDPSPAMVTTAPTSEPVVPALETFAPIPPPAMNPLMQIPINQDNHSIEAAHQPAFDIQSVPNVFVQPVVEPFENYPQYSQPLTTSADEPSQFSQPEIVETQEYVFESASTASEIKYDVGIQSPSLIVDEPLNEYESPVSVPKVATASMNDPEFITQFSNASTYEEPGNKYDYEVNTLSVPLPQVQQSPLPPDHNHNMNNQLPAPDIQFTPVQQFAQPVFQPAPDFVELPSAKEYSFDPVARKCMNDLFYKMADNNASDLHMSVSAKPMIRKDGKMQILESDEEILTLGRAEELLTSIMPEKNREEYAVRNDTDFAYEIPGLARFRANIFRDRKGMGGVFRIIPSKILTAEQLKLSKAIMDLTNLSKGLVVVTGPTGSGKSTTLCAMVDSINKTREDHIITIEDPIEFTHENQQCLVNQREVHNHTDSFKDALRAALREDPDILLVGEMRDLETISIAIETAETGHLVFGTLHTTTAASTIDRIIDQFPADRQQQIRVMLSESLKGVIAQTLLPKKGGGRVAALEVLIVTPAISNLIREGKTFQIPSAMQTGKNLGMVMLNDALFAHVQSGAVEPRDAYIKAVDKTGFEQLLTRNGFKL